MPVGMLQLLHAYVLQHGCVSEYCADDTGRHADLPRAFPLRYCLPAVHASSSNMKYA
jgi:hypothetical protein